MSDAVSRAPHRSRQFWINHVQQWQQSGVSRTGYCEKHNIKRNSFYTWAAKAKINHSDGQPPNAVKLADSPPIQFHPVKLTATKTPSGQFVHVVRAGTDVAIPPSVRIHAVSP